MPGIYDCIIRQDKEFVQYGSDDGAVRTSGKIGASDALLKERVTGDQILLHQQADGTRSVPRGMDHFNLVIAHGYCVAIIQDPVRSRSFNGRIHVCTQVLFAAGEHQSVRSVDHHRALADIFKVAVTADMISMPVSIDDSMNL